MKKVLFLLIMLASIVTFGQEATETATEVATEVTETVTETSLWDSFDIWTILSVVLGVLSVVFGSLYTKIQTKLKRAGELLTALADAIEDKKIDANERTDLSAKVKALIGKS